MSEMLTLEETSMICEMNPSARKKLFRLLEAFEKSDVERSELTAFKIEKLEYGTSFVIRYSCGALYKTLHVIIGKRGGFSHVEKEGKDMLDSDTSVSVIWKLITEYLERF